MKVSDCMTRDVRVVGPESAVRDAARQVLEADTGAMTGVAQEGGEHRQQPGNTA